MSESDNEPQPATHTYLPTFEFCFVGPATQTDASPKGREHRPKRRHACRENRHPTAQGVGASGSPQCCHPRKASSRTREGSHPISLPSPRTAHPHYCTSHKRHPCSHPVPVGHCPAQNLACLPEMARHSAFDARSLAARGSHSVRVIISELRKPRHSDFSRPINGYP